MSDHNEDMYEKMKPEVKMFLEDFPIIKLQLEELIKKLHYSADKITKIHKDCTITSIVASSAGAVSGIMTIAGMALAPVTGGLSLSLCLGGMGLGIAATVTDVSAAITDIVSDSLGSRQLDNVEEKLSGIVESLTKLVRRAGSIKTFKNISNFSAFRLLKDEPGLIFNTKFKKICTNTVSGMTKNARISTAIFAGIFVVTDIISIVKDSVHLSKGAKAPTAAKLRKKALDLEKKLQELSCLYETLREMETQLAA